MQPTQKIGLLPTILLNVNKDIEFATTSCIQFIANAVWTDAFCRLVKAATICPEKVTKILPRKNVENMRLLQSFKNR